MLLLDKLQIGCLSVLLLALLCIFGLYLIKVPTTNHKLDSSNVPSALYVAVYWTVFTLQIGYKQCTKCLLYAAVLITGQVEQINIPDL